MFIAHPLIKPNTVELRKYQESIIATSVNKNTLVVLPTGLGKTLIAIIVSAYRLSRFNNSKVLFLTPTKPLAVQHANSFRKILNLKDEEISVFTSATSVKKRNVLWENSKVIVATPQTIENEIMRGLHLEDVSFVVFDEAHRAVGNYAYCFIAREYMKKAKNPLIMGLSASPSSEIEKISEISKNLFIENVEIRTENDPDVKEYVMNVDEEWVKVELPENFKTIRNEIVDLLKSYIKNLKGMNYINTINLDSINKKDLLSIQERIREDILKGTGNFEAASLIAKIIKIHYALELIETQGIFALLKYIERLRLNKGKGVKEMFSDIRMMKIYNDVKNLFNLKVDHPKIDALLKVLKENLTEDKKILIFTQYRDTSEKIYEVLKSNNIKCEKFIGQAKKGSNKGMSQKEQVEILERFRNNEFNVLIATSVAEEGLDIPKVDIVIFYEPIPSCIRTIQRKGRTGRLYEGKVIILMTKGTRDEGYYWSAISKERKMKKCLKKIQIFGNNEIKMDTQKKTGQQNILLYINNEKDETKEDEKKVKIYIDTRERNTEIFKILNEKADVEVRQLEVGDYIVSDRVCIERKTASDFLGSIIDKRLLEQAENLKRNFEISIIIVEGELNFASRNIHPNAIRGAIASVLTDFKISIIHTKDEKDTAEMIFAIAKREQIEKNRPYALIGEKKSYTLTEKQLLVIESFPNVSAVIADRLLAHFKTIKNIVSANVKQLMKVEGIGQKRAEEIFTITHTEYKKENF